jgi:hypothetical protein
MQTTTYAEHCAQVDAIRTDLFVTARGLQLTEGEKDLVRFIAEHASGAMTALTSLLRRVV